MCQTRISFRLNEHYDADLIQYLSGAKNKSRELRRIIRLGLKVLAEKQKREMSDNPKKQQKKHGKTIVWKFGKS